MKAHCYLLYCPFIVTLLLVIDQVKDVWRTWVFVSHVFVDIFMFGWVCGNFSQLQSLVFMQTQTVEAIIYKFLSLVNDMYYIACTSKLEKLLFTSCCSGIMIFINLFTFLACLS